jgi:hypothetical protein
MRTHFVKSSLHNNDHPSMYNSYSSELKSRQSRLYTLFFTRETHSPMSNEFTNRTISTPPHRELSMPDAGGTDTTWSPAGDRRADGGNPSPVLRPASLQEPRWQALKETTRWINTSGVRATAKHHPGPAREGEAIF